MNKQNLEVLAKIIICVETGGQVYGKGRYNDYTPPYKNTPNEHTITLGAAQWYGNSARELIQYIYDADPAAFKKADTCSPSIESMLKKDWVSIRWKPNSKQKAVLIALISSQLGIKCQNELFAKKCETMVNQCVELYPETKGNVKAQMMYAEIKHLGGLNPVKRIFNRLNGDYSLDAIMASLVKDQSDKSSSNQVGDKIFWSRHVKCRQYIDQYSVAESETKTEKKSTETEKATAESKKTSGNDPQKVIDVAMGEVGYYEKKSNSSLDSKTANAGSNNYTKYWRDMRKDYQGSAWCDCFVGWCFVQAYGKTVAEKLQCGGTYSFYTPTSASYYKKKNQWFTSPKVGDQAFFKNSQRICHTGIVYAVDSSRVYTVEGNAGNKVQKKSYSLKDGYIAGFGRPDYGMDASGSSEKGSTVVKSPVEQFQVFLNGSYGKGSNNPILVNAGVGNLVVDGNYGQKTRAAAIAVWKYMANRYYKGNLTIGNTNFAASCTAVAGKMTNAEIEKHPTLAKILQGLLAGKGYYTGTVDGEIGAKTKEAVNKVVSGAKGNVTADVWSKLFN